MPRKIVVQPAITGAFFSRRANPNQPQTTAEIVAAARQCVRAGASAVHIHVRDDRGYNALSVERFEEVVLPLQEEFPDLSIDGCYACALDGEWDQMKIASDVQVLVKIALQRKHVFELSFWYLTLTDSYDILVKLAGVVHLRGAHARHAVNRDFNVNWSEPDRL